MAKTSQPTPVEVTQTDIVEVTEQVEAIQTAAEIKISYEDTKKAEIAEQTAKAVANAKANIQVLNAYRVEKRGKDAVIFERVILNENYAGGKGVQEFELSNGDIIYYVEKPVKKYSDNVARA